MADATLGISTPPCQWRIQRGFGGSNEPPLEPKLFHFHGEFQEKIGQTAQIEPPSANLNPQSKNPGSGPACYPTHFSWPLYLMKVFHLFLWIILSSQCGLELIGPSGIPVNSATEFSWFIFTNLRFLCKQKSTIIFWLNFFKTPETVFLQNWWKPGSRCTKYVCQLPSIFIR